MAPGTFRWLVDTTPPGPLYMIVSIERQMVHVYSGDMLIGESSISTGMKGHRTPLGDYPILQKREWHRSNIYSNAPMPFMQRLTWDGIALHAGHNPGYPASHGCIRLPAAFAKRLFGMTSLGTLVSVTASQSAAMLTFDSLVANDPDATIVTFTPGPKNAAPSPAVDDWRMRQPHWIMPGGKDAQSKGGDANAAPMLMIDPAIFQPMSKDDGRR